MRYLSEGHLDPIFELLSKRYSRAEEIPPYHSEHPGFEKLCGILEQARSDTYYPSLLEKASFILIAINKGHFFSNGNKRLALVAMTTFLDLNSYQLKESPKDTYREFLTRLFSEYAQWEDFDDFTPTDFATYNLSIMIADSGVYQISHDTLKARILSFLSEFTEKVSE